MDMARRSSRAYRASQAQITLHHSITYSRPERATRSSLKAESPEKSTPSSSLSSEPPDETNNSMDETSITQTRRKRGRTEEQRDKPLRTQTLLGQSVNGSEEVGEDDEAVRCICGLDDYPGPPQHVEENKNRTREVSDDQLISATDSTEDLAGFFLQCDICKVWQHGGCVGIKNEGSSPEEYFCERCRKDLHKIFTAPNGQRYSHYLPLHQSLPRPVSRATFLNKDGNKSPKSGKNGRTSSLHSANSKRRSTMNSRDAAYDEEEQLRRAIEASKDEKSGDIINGAPRRAKRGRSNSEEKIKDSKRQRTKSSSPSLSHDSIQVPSQPESDDGANGRVVSCKKSKASNSKYPKDSNHKEDREISRSEAINKRNGRAERRRTDESEISKETFTLTKPFTTNGSNSINTSASTSVKPFESTTTSHNIFSDNTHSNQYSGPMKKGGRPSNSRKVKIGRNQYTRDRDLQDHDDQLPHRSLSRDTLKIDDQVHLSSNKGFTGEMRIGKFKGSFNKITMTDMKKRVAAILDFISRTQLEMASEPVSQIIAESTQALVRGLPDDPPIFEGKCDKNNHAGGRKCDGEDLNPANDFKDLSCRDMMDVLTKQLIKWQKEFL